MSGLKFHVLCKTKNTVWDPDESPLPAQLTFVKSHSEANVIVSNNEFTLKQALEDRLQNHRPLPKACILWTMEPYYSTHTEKKLNLYGIPMYIFNIWNKNALFNNGTILFQQHTKLPLKPLNREVYRCKDNLVKMVALITYPKSYARDTTMRVNYALDCYQRNVCDIYGKGWPGVIAKGNNHDGDCQGTKAEILSKYDYNLALENCIQPYYITEQLWDPIFTNTLPIYSDNRSIYYTFPRDSFIDIDDYSSTEKLIQKINSMSLDEYNARREACWDSMAQAWRINQEAIQSFWTPSAQEVMKVVETLS
jgi:hypothetical protein